MAEMKEPQADERPEAGEVGDAAPATPAPSSNGQQEGSQTRSLRKAAERLDKALDKSASLINNLQTIITLLGAMLGSMAFLNLELGLLASLNTLFHGLADFVVRAKLPLAIGLVAAAAINLAWLLRRQTGGQKRRHWAPLIVALALAGGVILLKPVPYEVAVLVYEPFEGSPVVDNILGSELATLLAAELQADDGSIRTVLASEKDRSPASLAAVAQEKGVDFVADGTFALRGPNLEVHTRVFDARSQEYLDAKPFAHFDLRDNIEALQRLTSADVLRALPLYSRLRNRASASAEPAACDSAYACYLQGRQYQKWHSQEGYQQAIAAFQRAIALEPNYALAHAGLAEARTLLAGELRWISDFQGAETILQEASESARTALELEPNSLESLRATAWLHIRRGTYDEAAVVVNQLEEIAPDDAETLVMRSMLSDDAQERLELLQRAVELAPDLALARHALGSQLWEMGQAEEALPHLRAAVDQNPYDMQAHNGLGWIHLRLGQPTDAEAQARLALKLQPQYGDAAYLLGFALAAQGSTSEAIEILQTAIAEAPELGMVDERLTYSEADDYAASITFLEQLRSQQPDFVHVYNALGNLYRNVGRLAEAETAYREALRRDPSLGIAHFNLASLYLDRLNDPAAAERPAQEAVRLLPELPASHRLLARILGAQQRYQEAEASLRTAVELSPNSPWAQLDLVDLYLTMGNTSEAKAAFEAFRRFEPEEAYPYNYWGNVQFQHGDFSAAAEAYRRAIELAPDNSIYYSNLARTLARMDDPEGAQASCHRAIELAPEANDQAYVICGQQALEQGDYEAALALAERGLAAMPSSSDLLMLEGMALSQAGRWEEADSVFAKAADLAARDGFALNSWGIELLARGDVEQAAGRFENALLRSPNNPDIMANLADAYLRLGRLEDAAGLAGKAIEIQPANPWAQNVRGDVLAAQGDYRQALVHYQQAVAASPSIDIAFLQDLVFAHMALEDETSAEQVLAQAAADSAGDPAILGFWGSFLLTQGRLVAAEEKLQQAFLLNPNDPLVLTNLGDVYWNQERYEEAAGLYQQAVDVAPGYDYALGSLGQTLWELGRFDEAIPPLMAAVAQEPTVLWYQIYLAKAQIDAGDLEGAQQTLEKAAQLAPDDPDVEDLQAELDQESRASFPQLAQHILLDYHGL